MRQYVDTFTSSYHKDTEDLVLFNCGTEQCDVNHFFGPIARDFNLIHFVSEGKGNLIIDEIDYPINKNQAFFIPADKVAYYQADKTNPWNYYWIGFTGINASEYMLNIVSQQSNPYVWEIENIQYYTDIILKMIEVGESGVTLRNHLILQGHMYHLLGSLISADKSINTVSNQDYIFQAQNYMNKNFAIPLKIEKLAKDLGLHPNYLTSIFKKNMGITPKEYLMDIRMSKAANFLLHTNYRIKVIANSVGYSDPLTFSRAFKKYYKTSPERYRQLFLAEK